MSSRAVVLVSVAILAIAVFFRMDSPALGQGAIPLEAETELFKFRDHSPIFNDLIYGRRQPGQGDSGNKISDEKLISLAAKYYVYSPTVKALQQDPGVLHRFRENGLKERGFRLYIIKYIKDPRHVNKNTAFQAKFTQEMIKRFDKVFALPFNRQEHRVAIVNAGLLLPILAELQRQEAANYFSKLLEKKDSPLPVKLFACQALKTHFTDNAPNVLPFESKGRDQYAKQIDPLIAFLFSTPKELKKMSSEEIDAYRYVRCEAVKALAQTKLAWLPELPPITKTKPPKVHAPVAYALLKVLEEGKSGLSPESSLEEKIEAVKGLCQIDAKRKLVKNQEPYYNPEPAVNLIGKTVLEFADAYRIDYVVFTDKKKKNLPPLLAWKHAGEALRNSLSQLKRNVAFSSKTQEYVNAIANKSEIIFDQTIKLRSLDDPFDLRTYVKKLPQPKSEVYRGFDYKVIAAN